jgi:hypothetical protein
VNFRPARENDGVGDGAEEVKEGVDGGVRVKKGGQGSLRTAQEGARDRWWHPQHAGRPARSRRLTGAHAARCPALIR